MSRYLLRRLSFGIGLVFAVMTTVFVVLHMVGNPASLMLSLDASREAVARLAEEMGLNDPLPQQYARFMVQVFRGDLGDSLRMAVPALPLVIERLPATFLLTGVVIACAVPLGIALGILASLRRGSLADRSIGIFSLTAISAPESWIGLMLMFFLAVYLGLVPTSGYGTLQHLLLPALTLLLRPAGRIAQVTRSTLLDELHKQYIMTARSKGLSTRAIWTMHALKNAAIPIVTLVGDEIVSIVNGAIVVEVVFGWPGVGMLTLEAIQTRDLPLVEAAVLVIAIVVVAVNLLVDVIYACLNPRVRHALAS